VVPGRNTKNAAWIKIYDCNDKNLEKNEVIGMGLTNFKLSIELVPSTVWYSSVYQFYNKTNQSDKWKRIKAELFKKEGRQCWICGKVGGLEAHEFWEYDDRNYMQKLSAIHHLCDLCHKIKHIGFWCHTEDGKEKLKVTRLSKRDLINHFCMVNNCSQKDFEIHETDAFDVWKKRSAYDWKQDFGNYDIKDAGGQSSLNSFKGN